MAKATAAGRPCRPLYLKDPSSAHVGQALFEVRIGDLIATAGFSPSLPGKVAITVMRVVGFNQEENSPTCIALLQSIFFHLSPGDRNQCNAPDVKESPQAHSAQALINATVEGLLSPGASRSAFAFGVSAGAAQEPVEYQDYQIKIARAFRNLLRDPVKFILSEGQTVVLEGEGARFYSSPGEITSLAVVPGLALQLSTFGDGSYDLRDYPEDGTKYIVPPIVAAVSKRKDFYVVDISKHVSADQCVRSLRQYT